MTARILLVFLLVGLAGPAGPVRAQDTFTLFERDDRASWRADLTGGYDATLHTYALATEDTTETIAEFMIQAGLLGESARNARTRWRLRGEASTGTELWRQKLEGDLRLADSRGATRFRASGRFWGRQFRRETEYVRSSDNWEGTLEGRLSPLAGPRAALDLRGWAGFIDYRNPSTLEVDYHDTGVGLFGRSRGLGAVHWSGGVRHANRVYPDSSAIDRDTWSVEADVDYHDLDGAGLRVFHKSDRRLIADETVRPSAWTHWSDLRATVRAGGGHVVAELQSEVWRYDQETGAYFDSWRTDSFLGYRWGDILKATWRAGLTFERLDADESPETYAQWGLRGGVDAYGSAVGGQITLEYGRRTYDHGAVPLDPTLAGDLGGDSFLLYSDFDYWKIWVMGNWFISRKISLDVMASYEPESHTENTDDTAIGYASVRLVWRP